MRRAALAKVMRKIAAEFGCDVPVKVVRTYAGYWQRTSGGWSWYLDAVDPDCKLRPLLQNIGSMYPATEIARAFKAGRMSVGSNFGNGYELFVEEGDDAPQS